MSRDLLSELEARLATQQEVVEREMKAFSDLETAVRALKGPVDHADKPASTEAREQAQPERKRQRGALKRTVLDCVREGIATTAEIHAACEARGISTSKNSISNTLRTLTDVITFDTTRGRYALRDLSTNGDELMEVLEESAKIEGSKVSTSKPSILNGGPDHTVGLGASM